MGLEKIDSIPIIDAHVHGVDPWYWIKYVGTFPFGIFLEKPNPSMLLNKRKTYIEGYRTIYDFPYDDLTPENEKELDDLWKASIGDNEAGYVLKAYEKAGVESAIEMCLSGPELPPGLGKDRFRMAVLLDGLMLPLDNSQMGQNERAKQFITMGENYRNILLEKYKPSSFDEYMDMVNRGIKDLIDLGVVSLKFNFPYWRDIKVDIIEKEDAVKVWDSKDSSPAAYKKLQDYILRIIMTKAAETGLPVQIHSGGIGITQQLYKTDPLSLEDLLWLPEVKPAKVVLLHGAYPYYQTLGYMASRTVNAPNIYIDMSMFIHSLAGTPQSTVPILREWLQNGLEDKIMYGSDGFTVLAIWMGAVNARKAIKMALEGMISDGYIDEDRALVIAEKILRGNAIKLYNL